MIKKTQLKQFISKITQRKANKLLQTLLQSLQT